MAKLDEPAVGLLNETPCPIETTHQAACHGELLRTLARKQEPNPGPLRRVRDPCSTLCARAGPDRSRFGRVVPQRFEHLPKGCLELLGIAGDDRGSGARVGLHLRRQLRREVRELAHAQAVPARDDVFDATLQPVHAICGHHENLAVLCGAQQDILVERGIQSRSGRVARLERHVCVDPPEAHRRNAGPKDRIGRLHPSIPQRIEHAGIVREGRARVRAARGWWNHAPVCGNGRFDEPPHARGGLGVPDDRLEGGHPAASRLFYAVGLHGGCNRLELDRIPSGGPGTVAFDEMQARRRVSCALVRSLNRQGLALHAGRGNATGAIGRNAPAAQGRVDVVAICTGIFETLEHDETTPLARQETVRCAIVHAHLRWAQGSDFGKAHELERVEADVDPANQGHVEVSTAEHIGCRRDREKRRCTGAIDDVAPTLKVEEIADATRDRIGQRPSERIFVDRGEHRLEIRLRRAD